MNSCAHQLFSAAHRGLSQIFPWPLQACTLKLRLQLYLWLFIYLLFFIIYLFYVAVGEKIIIRKHALVCFYFNVVVSIIKWSNLSHVIFQIVFEWSGGGTAGFCLEPCRWVTEQNKDGKAKCGCAVLEGRSTWTGKWSETHVRQSDSGYSSQGC